MKEKIARSSLLVLVAIVITIGTRAWGEGDRKSSIGERFHSETSLTWSGALADLFRAKPRLPPLYKHYLGAKKDSLPSRDQKFSASGIFISVFDNCFKQSWWICSIFTAWAIGFSSPRRNAW